MVELNRSALLVGQDNIDKLANAKVMVIGLGGVGGFCVEALARSGIGNLVIVDFDTIDASNCNRQLIALQSNIGSYKTDMFVNRIKEINPNIKVSAHTCKYDKHQLDASIDYIVDCMDDVNSKVNLLMDAAYFNIPVLTVCGTARKTDPSKLCVTRLDKTENDPLAKSVRCQARKLGVSIKNKAIYSKESSCDVESGQPLPSMVFVPATAGLLAARTCIFDLMENQ